MTRTVSLLRISSLAYAEIVESLKLCGDEGLRRIKPDGKHLDVSDLVLEVDPGIHLRFPQPDLDVETKVFVGGGEKHYPKEPKKPVFRKYHVSVRGFPTTEVVCLNSNLAKFAVLKALQNAGHFAGKSQFANRNDFLFACKVKAKGVTDETTFRITELKED